MLTVVPVAALPPATAEHPASAAATTTSATTSRAGGDVMARHLCSALTVSGRTFAARQPAGIAGRGDRPSPLGGTGPCPAARPGPPPSGPGRARPSARFDDRSYGF